MDEESNNLIQVDPDDGSESKHTSKSSDRTTVLMLYISRVNLLTSVIMFISLTIKCISTWWRNDSTSVVMGYNVCLFLFGIGISIQSVYAPGNIYSKLRRLSCVQFREQPKMEAKVSEHQLWIICSGCAFIIIGITVGTAEAISLWMKMNQFVRFTVGLRISFSVVFVLTGVAHLVAGCRPGRKQLLAVMVLAVVCIVGGCVISRNRISASFFDHQYFFQNSNQEEIHFAYRDWKIDTLIILLSTPLNIGVSLSFASILLFSFILVQMGSEPKLVSKPSNEFLVTGLILMIFGIGVFVTFTIIGLYYGHNYYGHNQQLSVYFTFTLASLTSFSARSNLTSKLVRLLLMVLSVAVFATSIVLLVWQTEKFTSLKNSEERFRALGFGNETDEFCVCQNTELKQSNLRDCYGYQAKFCIPSEKFCDGWVDMYPYGNKSAESFIYGQQRYFDPYQVPADETNCLTIRYTWVFVFNFLAGTVGIIVAVFLFFKSVTVIKEIKLSLLNSMHDARKPNNENANQKIGESNTDVVTI